MRKKLTKKERAKVHFYLGYPRKPSNKILSSSVDLACEELEPNVITLVRRSLARLDQLDSALLGATEPSREEKKERCRLPFRLADVLGVPVCPSSVAIRQGE